MKALILVDVQNDFLPGGSLAVPRGDEIVPILNDLQEQYKCVIASKDWHPKGHMSFEQWPEHCVQKSWGAEHPKALKTGKIEKTFLKGTEIDKDSYSAFLEMEPYLKKRGVTEIFIVGLALDFCVKTTALDAVKRGWKTHVLLEGCRAIGNVDEVVAELKNAGIKIG